MSMFLGVDISKHNGNVNIKKVRDAGYKAIVIRAGYGNNNTDQKFVPNTEACVNLGVNTGFYWFMYSTSEAGAAKEGKYAVEHAKKYFEKNVPIAADLEYDTVAYAAKRGVNITKNVATAYVIAFLKEVEKAGFIPVLYTNKDYMSRMFDVAKIRQALDTPLYVWYARYTSSLSSSEEAVVDVWQYSSKGSVDGISGNVDMNKFYTDIFKKSVVSESRPATTNLFIKGFQVAANADGYRDQNGDKLVEDGIDGAKTQYVRKQINLKAKLTALGYRAGSTGNLVKWWESRMRDMGYYAGAIDGKYGPACRAATIAFQKAQNLKTDGIAGYNTISTSFYN